MTDILPWICGIMGIAVSAVILVAGFMSRRDIAEMREEEKQMHENQELFETAVSLAKSWKPASIPPSGENGYWTRDVIVVTNLGEICKLSYFHCNRSPGRWQIPSGRVLAGKPEYWIDFPAI